MSRGNESQSDGSPSLLRMFGRLVGAVFFLGVLAAGLLYAHYSSKVGAPVLQAGQTQTVVIPKGANWDETTGILRRAGLVEHPLYFELWARRRSLPRRVKAGTYHLEGPLGVEELAERLEEGGAAEEVRITFPEGLTIFHLADRVEERGLASREEFLKAARDDEKLAEAGIEADSFEGYLFPDTYRFRQGAPAWAIVERMHRQWREVWSGILSDHRREYRQLIETWEFDRHDVVTLASIVEAESGDADERRLIARVMLNRIDASMRLQTDPTCVYGPDRYLETPSPTLCKDPRNRYSTYVIDGLPPGPIGNPGRISLQAAVDPADGKKARQYLYFVAKRDGTGEHVFSRTYGEHRRRVRKHLK